jgi:hypothetical protein
MIDMEKGQRYTILTIIALFISIVGGECLYYSFPASFQAGWVQIELEFSMFASTIALYWALYGVKNGLFIVDKSKSTLKRIETRIEPFLGTISDRLIEFESTWEKLTPEQKEGVKSGMLTAIDLLEGKIKNLIRRDKIDG